MVNQVDLDTDDMEEEKKNDASNTTSTSKSSVGMEFEKQMQGEDYIKRQKQGDIKRLITARKWCLLVSLYYIIRACFIIYPKWDNHVISTKIVEICLFILFLLCLLAYLLTLRNKDHLEVIKYVLFVQIVQM